MPSRMPPMVAAANTIESFRWTVTGSTGLRGQFAGSTAISGCPPECVALYFGFHKILLFRLLQGLKDAVNNLLKAFFNS